MRVNVIELIIKLNNTRVFGQTHGARTMLSSTPAASIGIVTGIWSISSCHVEASQSRMVDTAEAVKAVERVEP